MLGLLIKDLYLLGRNKKLYIIFVGIAFMLAYTDNGEKAIMAIAYLTMVFGMSVITTTSYDEFDHSTAHLMTLPITRREYALEKALFGTLSITSAFLFSTVTITVMLMLRHIPIHWNEWLISGFSIFIVLYCMLALLLPIQIKFGGENGRMVVLGVGIGIAVVVLGSISIMKKLGIDVQKYIQMISEMLIKAGRIPIIIGTLMLLVGIMFLSIMVTSKILNKKEY